MAKIKKSPLTKIYGKRYLLNIDISNVSEELNKKLRETLTPKSNKISSKLRGISIKDAPMNTIEYMAFECATCNELLKMMCQIEYMIRAYEDDIYTKKEAYETFREWYPEAYDIPDTESLDF